MKNSRLFEILYILMEHRETTAGALAERLEVSVRTIYRDLDTLSAAGIPVYTEKEMCIRDRLDTINTSIKKYNQCLEYCRTGNLDMAKMQLKKVLTSNPKLIKGYHLLSLIYIKAVSYTHLQAPVVCQDEGDGRGCHQDSGGRQSAVCSRPF